MMGSGLLALTPALTPTAGPVPGLQSQLRPHNGVAATRQAMATPWTLGDLSAVTPVTAPALSSLRSDA